MQQVWRDGNEEHKVEYHKEQMGRNEEWLTYGVVQSGTEA